MSKPLITQTTLVFQQLIDAINQLDQFEYIKPIETLSGSSIGQHLRHIIEFYQSLMNGYETGVINYDKRVRDKMIEESREFAIKCINKIIYSINTADSKKILLLEIDYDIDSYENNFELQTSFERELLYNVEHSIHHMAIIKIGIKEINSKIILPSEFGVAASTIRHQQQNHVHSNLLTQS